MRIYTSRFNAQDAVIASAAVPVRISIGHPRFRLRYPLKESIPDLMPSRAMLTMPKARYRSIYLARLEDIGLESLQAEFQRIARAHGGKDLVLLCFEDLRKPGAWCHRRMVADFWTAKTGQPVEELEKAASEARTLSH